MRMFCQKLFEEEDSCLIEAIFYNFNVVLHIQIMHKVFHVIFSLLAKLYNMQVKNVYNIFS